LNENRPGFGRRRAYDPVIAGGAIPEKSIEPNREPPVQDKQQDFNAFIGRCFEEAAQLPLRCLRPPRGAILSLILSFLLAGPALHGSSFA
jgi:hypothetical protein